MSENECKENIRKFYSYFDDSYKFEEFLKTYLEKIGLDEVVVTRRSGDGGIDLTAVRKGLGGLANAIAQPYFIQAKRYLPDRCVPPKFIRELRGSFSSGTGIFITTGKVSAQGKADAKAVDSARPIIVVDGEDLVRSCIDNEILQRSLSGSNIIPFFLEFFTKPFKAYLEDNLVTLENAGRTLTEIRNFCDLLNNDFDNPAVQRILDKTCPSSHIEWDGHSSLISFHFSVAEEKQLWTAKKQYLIDFYEEFCQKFETMLIKAKEAGDCYISFVGP